MMLQQHLIQLAIAANVLLFSRVPNIPPMQKFNSSHMLEYAFGMMNWPWSICEIILESKTWKISYSHDMQYIH